MSKNHPTPEQYAADRQLILKGEKSFQNYNGEPTKEEKLERLSVQRQKLKNDLDYHATLYESATTDQRKAMHKSFGQKAMDGLKAVDLKIAAIEVGATNAESLRAMADRANVGQHVAELRDTVSEMNKHTE